MQILETDVEGKVVADLTQVDDDMGVGPHVEVVHMSNAGVSALSLGKGSGVLAEEALTAPLDRALAMSPVEHAGPVGCDKNFGEAHNATGPHETVFDNVVLEVAGHSVTQLTNVEYADTPAPSAEVNVSDPPGRPSLHVALETLGHLRPRIEKLCERMWGWDKRELGTDLRAAIEGAIAKWETSTDDLVAGLLLLNAKGYVAKTTDKTRKLASMRKPGTKVRLDDSLLPAFAEVYSPEELDALEVVRTLGSKVFLKTGSREVGIVDVSKVEARV
jgi:hypothetical protein